MTSIWIAAAVFVCSLAFWKSFPQSRGRFRTALFFLLLCGAALAINTPVARDAALALVELAALQTSAGIILAFLGTRIRLPRFKIEIFVVAGYAAILFHLLYGFGVNVTGIFATSAVATAVIGLSLQDMLSNIADGLALELEREIHVGDYIKYADNAGWVKHVRLRHTAIETADGDRIILPNSFLVRSPITVVPKSRRTFIPFSLPYRHNPQDVMDAVKTALITSPLPGIATEPAPSCIVRDLATGHIQYAAVVWLLEAGRESVAVSAVLTRLWFALRRAGIGVTEISNLLEMRRTEPIPPDPVNPLDVLRATPIFRLLDDQSLTELSEHLRRLSYAPGEFILRQGEPGDSMYFVTAGEAAITYTGEDNIERRVSVISSGDFFGEATLLTGAPRTANAIAMSRLDCYQLDKAGLRGFMTRLPELAEDMAVVIAHRQLELADVREQLDKETILRREAESQIQLLDRIRSFFGLDDEQSAGL
jgi:small-conductance mechanosensitive channel/CRP-like cAMP-binding protein